MISRLRYPAGSAQRALRHHDEDRGHQRAHQALTSKLADTEQVRDDLAAILQRLGLATLLIDGWARAVSQRFGRPPGFPANIPFCLIGHALGGGVATHKVGPTGTAIDAATVNRATGTSPMSHRHPVRATPLAGRRTQDDPRDPRNTIAFLHDMTDVHHLRRLWN